MRNLIPTVLLTLAGAAGAQTIEISAPLFPKVPVLYAHQADAYPADSEGQLALASEALMSFPWLRGACADLGYSIVEEGDVPLSADETIKNYNEVARCSYEQFTAKPYLIPQLVSDVDLCASTLGEGWRMPTEAEVLAFPPEVFTTAAEVLTVAAGSEPSWGSFYFSLAVYVLGDSGQLRIANFHPDAAKRVYDLQESVEFKRHLEHVPFDLIDAPGWAPAVVRCLR